MKSTNAKDEDTGRAVVVHAFRCSYFVAPFIHRFVHQ